MATFKGATFEILSANQPCPIYDDPDAPDNEDRFTRQKYIEAVTGATFIIKVTLDRDFRFASSDAVRIMFTLDNMPRSYYEDVRRRDIRSGEKRSVRLECMQKYCLRTHQWQRGYLSFGKLEIKETTDSAVSPNELKNLGRIRVSYQRIKYGQTRDQRSIYHDTERVSEVSEKVLKGKSIENTIEYVTPPWKGHCSPRSSFVNLVESAPPDRSYVEGRTLPGSAGEEVTVNFLYRSKSRRHIFGKLPSFLTYRPGTLQMIGCIPRSPSPAPVNRSAEAPRSGTGFSVQEELRTLRVKSLPARINDINNTRSQARLAKLEGQTNTKAEKLSLGSVIKRERDKKEHESPRKRSRHSGPMETVDLTGD
ncbi:MAG: hypothetical protein Q9211_001841 [Gyalolechia sp. 1 TL-2023]